MTCFSVSATGTLLLTVHQHLKQTIAQFYHQCSISCCHRNGADSMAQTNTKCFTETAMLDIFSILHVTLISLSSLYIVHELYKLVNITDHDGVSYCLVSNYDNDHKLDDSLIKN